MPRTKYKISPIVRLVRKRGAPAIAVLLECSVDDVKRWAAKGDVPEYKRRQLAVAREMIEDGWRL